MTASTPFTVTTTLAFEWIAITEIVVCVTPLDTDAVYAVVPDAKAGVNVTPLSESDSAWHPPTRPASRRVRGNLNKFLKYTWAVAL